ncbi:MAG: MBOAT family protein [Deltaproteobacteria bacterium]|nr:MBOAT family protein [Deltaproteobacteria bacterium]
MLFNSISFIIFFFVVFSVSWLAANRRSLKHLLLFLSSLFFYGMWNPWYLPLILFTTWISWESARILHRKTLASKRKFWLGVSVVSSLGVLGVFKYALFAKSSMELLLGYAGISIPEIAFLNKIVLPVGISFYTFQTMSYTIDVYRGSLKPEPSLLNYSLYVSFFPQLVAGPIVRASDFLPQLHKSTHLSDENFSRGVFLVMAGLFKKVVIADFIAINLVDRVFLSPDMMSSVEVLMGIYGYTAQIYCDFSGYSDVAIGSALLLGFKLGENFNQPFRSASLSEFWKRWHISLSSWLRDYLYIPLGGSRTKTVTGTQINLMITMLLGGLWHGSAWKFVFWGALHGAGLVLFRITGFNRLIKRNAGWRILGTIITLNFVVFAFLFFRASSFSNALHVLSRIKAFTLTTANLPWKVSLLIFTAYFINFIPVSFGETATFIFQKRHTLIKIAVLVLFAFLIQKVSTAETAPFIYFRF